MTRVTAVVPAYNASRFIRATVESLLAQSHDDLEIIVVDDGSEDNTRELVQCCFPQVRLISQQNGGVAAARNAGIREATGDYIAPVDADDIWQPDAARQLAACLDNSSHDVAVAYAWSAYIDEAGKPIDGFCASTVEGKVWALLLCHNFLGNASATMLRKSCLEQVGVYDSRYREQDAQGCEDWDLYLRLAERYEYRVVPEFMIGYRKLSGSMSMGNPATMARSQDLLMQRTKLRHPSMPRFLIPFSTGSYYLYLSSECRRNGSFAGASSWLWRALVRGHVFVLIRPDFYARWIVCWLRIPIRERTDGRHPGKPKRTARLKLNLQLQRMLHRLVSACYSPTLREQLCADDWPAQTSCAAPTWSSPKP